MSFPDARLLSAQGRAVAAWRAHQAPDLGLPELKWFNSAPCAQHTAPDPFCGNCGIVLRKHQRIGIAWLYWAGTGLLADSVGLGKTAEVAGMLALCKESGELSLADRAVVICQASAVQQWKRELHRMVPGIAVIAANGTPEERVQGYLSSWEVAIVSSRTFAPARVKENSRDGDVEKLRDFPVSTVISDDLDELRNEKTATSWAVKRLARLAHRVHILNGTPLQKHLIELYNMLELLGGRDIFGSRSTFRQRYVSQKPTYFYQQAMVCPEDHLTPPPYRKCQTETEAGVLCGKPCRPDPTHRKVLRKVMHDSGINAERLPDFQRRLAPLVLRRTVADLNDVTLPRVQYNPVHLELSPRQRARYAELRKGTLRRLRTAGTEISQAEAQVAFTRGAQICSGLAALDDGQDDSVKLDWAVNRLTGDLAEDKAVCFVYFKPNVQALSDRLTAAGVGHVLMWSEETDPKVRDARVMQFTTDPDCRVLVGTTTIERSLNLQVARHLIAVDTVMNAARMEQIVGRLRRDGSRHAMVLFHHLLARGTQEDGYLDVLRGEAAMASSVWSEESAIFPAELTPRQLMSLVATGTV